MLIGSVFSVFSLSLVVFVTVVIDFTILYIACMICYLLTQNVMSDTFALRQAL